MLFTAQGGGKTEMIGENTVERTQGSKTGQRCNFNNRQFCFCKQSYGVVQPETVDIRGERSIQNVAECVTDVNSAQTQCFSYTLGCDGFQIVLLTIVQNTLFGTVGLVAALELNVIQNEGEDRGKQQNEAFF